MATTDKTVGAAIPFPDLASPEFAGVRSDLARLYLKHRDVLGLGDTPDTAILGMTDDITAALLGLTMRALLNQDRAWLVKHAWFGVAAQRLLHGEAATALDG